ncbi:thioester reductase domain-containing protein, partial [Nocardia jiangsuensis]
VTVTDFVPSMLTVFVAHATAEQVATLRAVFVIGEALPPETAAGLRAISSAGLHNLYGPTEAAVSVTYWEATTADTVTVPIGIPEWNVAVYVLDGRLRPAAIGAPGELYLGGRQLARGYRGRADLTSDRFVANPFAAPGERMYRTGDLVRWNSDGVLEYIGRTDFQVKFRGQRIELGEIEAVARALPEVAQSAVLAVESPTGPQLIAYVVPAVAHRVDPAHLREVLRTKLPAIMVPRSVVVLDALPLNTSGKLDRTALPQPPDPDDGRGPDGPTELLVAEVFADLLESKDLRAEQDFYALGGNSLLAFQAHRELELRTALSLPIREFFRTPSIESVARLIDGHRAETSVTPALSDAAMQFAVRASPHPAGRDYLLTGATGFLGAHLLSRLLIRPDARIHCAVRATDEQDARNRIAEAMRRFGVAGEQHRIRPIALDLAEPDVGQRLRDAVPEPLAGIVHCAAQVNHVDEYERLRPANVIGTAELLRFAAATGTGFHHISTTSIFTGATGPVAESEIATFEQVGHSGYLTSKWVGEQLVRTAAAAGLPTAIYRTSLISGDSGTGIAPLTDSLWTCVRAVLDLGLAPRLPDFPIELVPVDYVADTIAHLVQTRVPDNATYHLVNHEHLGFEQILEVAARRGSPLRDVDIDEFIDRLQAETTVRIARGDYSLAGAALLFRTADWRAQRAQRFDDTVTAGRRGSRRPIMDLDIVDRYLAYFEDIGFFPGVRTPVTAER